MSRWLRRFTTLLILTLASVCVGAPAQAWEAKTAHRGFATAIAVAATEIAALSASRIKEKSLSSTDFTSDLLIYAYANPTAYDDPSGRCANNWCGAGMAYGFAKTDAEREAAARAMANTDPVVGFIAGTVKPLVQTTTAIGDFVQDLGSSSPEAKRRMAQRWESVKAHEREMLPYKLAGDAMLAAKLVGDLGKSIGTHAAQLEQAYDRNDFVGVGEAAVGLGSDVAQVTGAAAAGRQILSRAASATVVEGASGRPALRSDPAVELDELGTSTASGSDVFHGPGITRVGSDQASVRVANNVAREEGVHDVVVHGMPHDEAGTMFYVDGLPTHSEQIAGAVRANPSWSGERIRLLTCYGACGPAQELSTSLGVPVRAATKPVGVMQVPGSKPVVRDGGEWLDFMPEEKPQ